MNILLDKSLYKSIIVAQIIGMFFQKKTAVAAVVAHIFNPSDGILSTSPDTKPKIEFLQSSEELREIHFVSRNNLVEIEKGLASNLHSLQCFRSRRKVGKSGGENSKTEFTAKFRRNCGRFIL